MGEHGRPGMVQYSSRISVVNLEKDRNRQDLKVTVDDHQKKKKKDGLERVKQKDNRKKGEGMKSQPPRGGENLLI